MGPARRLLAVILLCLSLTAALIGPAETAGAEPKATDRSGADSAPAESGAPAPGGSSPASAQAAAADAPAVGGPGEYQYDAAGRIVGVVQNGSQAARYTYDAAGNVTVVDRYPASQLAVVSVVPAVARPGASVLLRGTGFPTSGAVVKFNGTTATVTAATATQLTVTVPTGVTTGPVTVTSGSTTATGPTFTAGAAAPVIGTVSPASGPAGTAVTINGSGFLTERANDVVTINGVRAEVTAATATSLTVVVPNTATSGRLEISTPNGTVRWSSEFAVPPSGVDPATIESTRRLDPGSAPTAVSVSAGKVALILFDAPAGGRINLGFSGSTFGGYVDVNVLDARGRRVASGGSSSAAFEVDATGLQSGATQQIVIDPPDTAAGQVTVTVSAPLTGTLSTSGAGTTTSISRIGQDFVGSLTASAGQALAVGFTANTLSGYSDVTVLAPDGSVALDSYLSGATSTTSRFVAAATGTYTVVLDPSAGVTGSVTLTASVAVSGGTLSATGPSVAATTSRPGQAVVWTFAGTAGGAADLGFTANSLPSYSYVDVVAPDGSLLLSDQYVPTGSSPLPLDSLPATGTYTLRVEPSAAGSGSITVTYSLRLAAGALSTTAAGTTVTVSRPGQSARLTLAGTAGQPLTLAVTANSLTGYAVPEIYGPDGKEYDSGYVGAAANAVIAFTPKATGTQTVELRPHGAATGALTLTLSGRVAAGTLSTTAAGVKATTTRVGQAAAYTFAATAGQNLSLGLTSSTFSSYTSLALYAPDGTVVSGFSGYVSGTTPVTVRIPTIGTAGTYTLAIEPSAAITGSVTTTLSADLSGGSLTVGGAAKAVSFSRPGQGTRLTFSGTAGQQLDLRYSGLASGYYVSAWVYAPSGSTVLNDAFLYSSGTSVTIPSLPAAGTYQLLLSPDTPATGSMSVSLATSAAAAAVTPVAPAAGPTRDGQLQEQRTVRRVTMAARAAAGGTAAGPVSTPQWRPDRTNLRGQDWVTRRAAVVVPADRRASAGVTAVSGHVVTLDGRPLAKVTVTGGGAHTRTDARGRFLLRGVPASLTTVVVDGASASRPTARYGLFRIRVQVRPGRTTPLPATVWMPRLDTAHTVTISAPTIGETVLTTPAIPGLEVRIPAGSVVRDLQGKVVTELGITPIPIDRTPFPLPTNGIVPVFFTVQPGGAAVFPQGAQIVYPNYTRLPPGQVVDFYNYDPEGRGWYVYGHGKVSDDATQVVPDADTRIWRFDGAMFNTGSLPAWLTSHWKDFVDWISGDPVDLSTGLMTDRRTDLAVDDVVPIQVSRTLWQGDTFGREFGVGQIDDYGMFLHSEKQYEQVDLYVPGGSKVHYVRTSPGTSYSDAQFAAVGTTSEFAGSTIKWYQPISGWQLTLSNGTRWRFPMYSRATSILDRNGNEVTLTRASGNGDLTQITSPNGRWIKLGYDTSGRVTSARDNIGRTVGYSYDTGGRLATVTDVAGRVQTYGYDANGRLSTIKDARGVTYLTNSYDANGRVSKQTLPGGAVYSFAYTLSGSTVTETRVTQPNGAVRRVTFDGVGAATSDTDAYGSSLARTTTYTRDADHRVSAVTDPFGRKSSFGYDSSGRMTSSKELVGTADEVTTATLSYGAYDLPTASTDAAGKTTRFGYDANGNLTSQTDPVGRVQRYSWTTDGQPGTATAPDGKVTSFGYRAGDQVTTTDPLGRVTRRFVDGAGRVVSTTDPAGSSSLVAYDAANQVSKVTDALGQSTAFEYDQNGNLTKLTDARQKILSWGYDAADRMTTATDQLGKVTTLGYDAAGRQTSGVSRAGRKTTMAYDLLDRPTTIGYGVTTSPESTATFGYDSFDRPKTKTDTAAGTVTFGYDVRDRVTSIAQARGTVGYRYDVTGQQTSVTAGGVTTSYGYDASGLSTSVTSGSDAVTTSYTAAGRPATTTLPGGWSQTNSYDAAGQLTAIAYAQNGTAKGTLSYTYDATGRTRTVSGSLAGVQLPAARSGLSYDAANRLTTAGSATLSYDADGNLTGDGTATYGWNSRGELTKVSKTGLSATFGYDAVGDRSTRTVNGTTTGFLANGDNPAVELDGSNAPTARLMSGGVDQWYARSKAGSTDAVLTDAQGSPVGLGAADGSIAARYGFDPFGTPTVSGTTRGADLSFTGRQDDGTGLLYYRARYYSPTLQRFISEDPSGVAGGVNLYAYANNDPTDLTDPSGNNPLLIGCAVGALTDGGISYLTQRLSGRKVDWGWGGVGGAALTGCAFGMLGGLGEGAGLLGRAARACHCFPAGTTVETADGAKPIEDVVVGDRVWAKSLSTGRPELRRVKGLFDRPASELVDVDLGGSTVTVTPDHPFWVVGRGWTDAGALQSGDRLASRTGDGQRVRSVVHRHVQTRVYNLSVDGDENFYVSDAELLVHNCSLALPKALQQGWNARAGYNVYLGEKGGVDVYVGITNNISRRAAEHGSRFTLVPIRGASGLTRGEARAIEQAMIVRARQGGKNYENIVNSISPLRGQTYSDAVRWGERWLVAHGL